MEKKDDVGGLRMNISDMILAIPALMISLAFHEYAHAKAADWQGDPTPRRAGRLTLNPISHIDPIGLVVFWLFRFGWAKPVPVNPFLFRNRRYGDVIVSIAGPATNFILAFIAVFIFRSGIAAFNPALQTVFALLIIYNLSFGIFNLLPIPPLDGSHVLKGFLPESLKSKYQQIESFSMIILIVLLWTGIIGRILGPAVYSVIDLFDSIAFSFFRLVGLF